MKPPEIGLSTAAFYPHYLTEDALVTIAGLGFRVVEVFLQTDEEYSLSFGMELDRRRRDLGLSIHSLHMYSPYFDLWSPYPRMARETCERFVRLLEIARMLDAVALTWHGLRYEVDDPRLLSPFLESAARAGEWARAAGVTLCIENVSWCYLRTPDHVRTIRETCPQLGFTFDAFQAGESGADPAALIRMMDSRLMTVHLADYAPGAPRHLPPGEGCLEWAVIMRTLHDVQYGGPLIIEPAHISDPAVFLRARDFIRRMWDEAYGVERG